MAHGKSYIRISWLIPSEFFFSSQKMETVGPVVMSLSPFGAYDIERGTRCKRPRVEGSAPYEASAEFEVLFPTWKHCGLE